MPSIYLIHAHRTVQQAAKSALANLSTQISATDSEASIAARAYWELCALGFRDTWYYNCPAFVLAGTRSCKSISGREYVASDQPVGTYNLVTVDLSPVLDGHWGDCARSFYVEDGRVTTTPVTPEFSVGQHFLKVLHADMQHAVHPGMTFHELFAWSNQRITAAGFENLDFLGNVGHSIATRREDRQYIEANNHCHLRDVPFFTFEPHVRKARGCWGFKHENIFFFNGEGVLEEL
jgi:Xaa-Pro aminopeptidase